MAAARTPTPDVVLAIKPSAPRAAAAPAESTNVSPLMRELAGGPLKPLYDRLSQKPSLTPEEAYVLARILEACTETGRPRDPRQANPEEARARFATSVSEKDPDRAKRIAAYQRISEARCAGFERMKTDPARIRELVDQAAAGGDPKARALVVDREVWACCDGGKPMPMGTLPTINDEQLNSLREIIRSGDPQAML